MNIIQKQPNPGGAYPAPQSWNSSTLPDGYVNIAESVDMTEFYAYNGFVTLTIEGDTVTGYIPNVEAWEEWKASLPEPEEPEPTTEERMAELENAMCEMDTANQEEITELQETTAYLEDALCDMEAANEERMAAIEDALCEMDLG